MDAALPIAPEPELLLSCHVAKLEIANAVFAN